MDYKLHNNKFYEYLYGLATDKHNGIIDELFKAFLFLLSLLYRLIIKIFTLFYLIKSCRLDAKVISIGNITVGGTGKTPLVEYTARFLKQQGHKVAIVSRGYKRKGRGHRAEGAGDRREIRDGYETMGDEPYMLSRNLGDIPVIVDKDRIKAGDSAIKNYSVDTILLDDGFQQWRLIKDLDIVAIDAANPFGNRQLIPRGLLREPLSSLKRAHLFILTKANSDTEKIKFFLNRINPSAQIFEAIHKPEAFYAIDKPEEFLNVSALDGKTISVFSGIADPASFENLLKKLGVNIGLSFRFCDHYNYIQEDINNIIAESNAKNIALIITTEKDAVRIAKFNVHGSGFKVLALRIGIKIINDEQEFFNRLLKLYSN